MTLTRAWLVPLIGGIMLFVAACAATQNLTSKQALYAVEAQYASLGEAALVYIHLPLCTGAPLEPVCAELKVVRAIQQADAIFWVSANAAHSHLASANANEYLGATAEALTAMRALLVAHAIVGASQ